MKTSDVMQAVQTAIGQIYPGEIEGAPREARAQRAEWGKQKAALRGGDTHGSCADSFRVTAP